MRFAFSKKRKWLNNFPFLSISQVGAHILTDFVIKLHEKLEKKAVDIECREYDNLLLVIANLVNFRVVAARLIYDILQKLADIFTEKEVKFFTCDELLTE